ncbi:uncharacterized protein FFB20_10402 [Fusarium fujikuroi]|uniref:Uncharacterized protein n=1 Tax=Fusarium fujikuroi TaxID=5127 RepID=A0A2H3SFS5_FUSFU|nr:uncharacterized protein Y057_12216 [Fusarium fujikuroi]QGI67736.1 hypothetical protein CEK27_011707 [Fusarium fujikuroi]QGI98621.1 hypothetical protein CEK26_011690 [Fusarium fujikuroi]SCN97518.1 uncharacterized protein FFB20_10402 [Fusarium fujikuroi]SCO11048.1 uncharacterized protein FFC1_11348 [Fusarium fujikuroi]
MESIEEWLLPTQADESLDLSLGHAILPKNTPSDERILALIFRSIVRPGVQVIFVGSPLMKTLAQTCATAPGLHALQMADLYAYAEFIEFCHDQRFDSDSWTDSAVLDDLVVVFHLNDDMSSECALALIAVMHFVKCTARAVQSCVRLLTASTDEMPRALSHLSEWFNKRPVQRLTVPSEIDEDMRRAKQVVVDTRDRDWLSQYTRFVRRGLEEQLVVYSPSMIDMPAPMETTTNSYGFKTSTVENTLRWRLFAIAFPEVRMPLPLEHEDIHVILDPIRHMRVYDSVTRQITHLNVSISAVEREEQVSVAFRTAKVPKSVTLYIPGRTVDEYVCAGRAPRRLSVCNAQAGGFLAAVRAFKQWELDADVASCFFVSPMERDVFKTMSRRVAIQLQVANANQLAEPLVRKLLPLVGYDHRLAILVALPCISDSVALTKIRWAALTSVGVENFVKFPDGGTIMGRENCKMMSVKHGSSSQCRVFGTTWTVLNLWADAVNALRYSRPLPVSQEWIQFPVTGVHIHLPSWSKMEELTRSISAVVGLPYSTSKFCDLDKCESLQLQRHLLHAYIFQLTKTMDSNRCVIDLATGTQVVDDGVNAWTTKAAERLEETCSLFGIYSDMERTSNRNTVRIRDWTWIPASIVADWSSLHTGSADLTDFLSHVNDPAENEEISTDVYWGSV